MSNKENGKWKHIHNGFGEPKCHCGCVALRGDSQNQSESHRLCEWTLWLNICYRNHRTTEKRKTQWFLWKFGRNTWIPRKWQTDQSGFGKRDFDFFWNNKTQKISSVLDNWTHKRKRCINILELNINVESLFGEKWNWKWLNKNVLWNHCKRTHVT